MDTVYDDMDERDKGAGKVSFEVEFWEALADLGYRADVLPTQKISLPDPCCADRKFDENSIFVW